MAGNSFPVKFLILPLFALSAWIIQPTTACHGFKIKSTSISWCCEPEIEEKNSPIAFENVSFSWDENCLVKFNEGTKITYKKPINKMEVYWGLKNYNNDLIENDGEMEDIFEEMKKVDESPDQESLNCLIDMIGLEKKCPIAEKTVEKGECNIRKSVTKSGLKTLFYGRTDLNFTLETDAGVACFCTAVEIEENAAE